MCEIRQAAPLPVRQPQPHRTHPRRLTKIDSGAAENQPTNMKEMTYRRIELDQEVILT